jgi:quercetin dioxygenase-like cupin family protein
VNTKLDNSAEALRTRYVLGGTVMEQHFSGSDTGSLFSLFENRAPVSSRTPIHVHAHDDETFYMLEGEMTAVVDRERVTLRAGDSILLPRKIPHQLLNESSEPARYLLLCTPSGFEGFLASGGLLLSPGSEPQPTSGEDIERMRAAAPRFGITLLREWPEVSAEVGTGPE